MNLGLDNRKKTIQAAVASSIALIGVIYLLWFFFSGTTPPPPQPTAPVVTTTSVTNAHAPAAPAGKAAEPIAYAAAQLDPTLHMEGMIDAESIIYGGSARNIFSTQSAPPPVPRPIAPARPKGPALPPPPPPPYVPPPPPPIDLKYFGTETSKDGGKRAFLLHGDDVFLASPGDIVVRRYKIDAILPGGVMVEDLPNNNTQMVPLTQQ
jgi:hypothetical protein